MTIKTYIIILICSGIVLISFTKGAKQVLECVDCDNCLELNGKYFGLNKVYNEDSTYLSYSINSDSSFYIQTPDLIEYVPTENLETGSLVFIDYLVDSLMVDFDLGKIQLSDHKIPKDLDIKLTVDGVATWVEDMQVIFISEHSRQYRISMMKDLNIILEAKKNNIPDYILIRRIRFFNSKLRDRYLYNSFLFTIEKDE